MMGTSKSKHCNKCNSKFKFNDIYYTIAKNKFLVGSEFIKTNLIWYSKIEKRYCSKCAKELGLI